MGGALADELAVVGLGEADADPVGRAADVDAGGVTVGNGEGVDAVDLLLAEGLGLGLRSGFAVGTGLGLAGGRSGLALAVGHAVLQNEREGGAANEED